MNTDRLIKLADYLENLDDRLFDINAFFDKGDDGSLEDFLEGKPTGAAGCAIGHLPRIFEEWTYIGVNPCLNNEDDNSFIQASKFFEINWNLAMDFFCMGQHDGKVGPKDVANRIRSLVNQ